MEKADGRVWVACSRPCRSRSNAASCEAQLKSLLTKVGQVWSRVAAIQVNLYEAKTRLSELLAEVEKGEQFVITRRGEAIARLVSAAPAVAKRSQALAQRQRVASAFDDLKRLRAGTTLGMPLRQAIEHGRD